MNKGYYKKGNVPHNKGVKMDEYLSEESIKNVKKTQFKKGEEHEGPNHISWVDGLHHMTKDCVHVWTGNGTSVRRPKMVYEKHFGPIPKGYIIYHIDGNKDNDDPNNLEAISRAELLSRNKS